MNHLNETGLIHRCYRDDNGWWRIPYRIAIEVAGPEALAVELPKGKPRGRTAKKRKSSETDDWDELVDELMERKEPLRQPPTNSISERAKRLVEEKLQYDINRAMQLLQAGVTPQMYAEEVKRYREGKLGIQQQGEQQSDVESSSDALGSKDKDKRRKNKEDKDEETTETAKKEE
jgi:hypothetical protein